jgi:beta-lactamase superfamily II metal-dependent hydrolase
LIKEEGMFKVQMLPAEYGDCLWIEYGDRDKPKRILIDAGTSSVYQTLKKKIEALPPNQRTFELLVVTHIDIDHIGGVLPLLRDADALGVKLKDVWFNGYSHIEKVTADDLLGALQGEALSARLIDHPWNEAFKKEPIVVAKDGSLPRADVAGMKITILSPRVVELKRLGGEWKATVEAAGLVPGVEIRRDPDEIDDLLGDEIDIPGLADSYFKSDAAKPNGSSIAFVASFEGKSVLFGADAFPGVLAEGLRRMSKEERDAITTLKLPHHGSRNNLSNELLELLPCRTFLISSNGKKFSHPNRESVARAIHRGRGAQLKFNYRTGFNDCWDNADLMRDFHYTAQYGGESGITVDC